MAKQLTSQWQRDGRGYLVFAILLPIRSRLLLQLVRIPEQFFQRSADAAGRYKVMFARRRIFAFMRVIDNLADLNPYVARSKGMIVTLTLMIIPATFECGASHEPHHVQ